MKNIFYSLIIVCIVGAFYSCSKTGADNSGNFQTNGKSGSLARFTVVGNYMYAIDNKQLLVFDVTNAKIPVLKNTLTVANDIETIYPFRDKLFIASNSGMFMYNISNPTSPTQEAFVQHVTGCDPVVANDSFAYLTIHSGTACGRNNVNELQIYNIKNSVSNNSFVGSIQMENPLGLGLHENTLFVCDKGNGLTVFDITDGAKPKLMQTIAGEEFLDVIPYNNTLICMLADGIAYYDITDVKNITKLSTIK
jgi:hypothetical protein